jgi:hypothetical protein
VAFVIKLKSKLDWQQGLLQDTVFRMFRMFRMLMFKIRSLILAADGVYWRVYLVNRSWISEIYGVEFRGY